MKNKPNQSKRRRREIICKNNSGFADWDAIEKELNKSMLQISNSFPKLKVSKTLSLDTSGGILKAK